jgi:hypothetical protein
MATSGSGPLRLERSNVEYDYSVAVADHERFQKVHADEWNVPVPVLQDSDNVPESSSKLIHELFIEYMDTPTTRDIREQREDIMFEIVNKMNDSNAGIFATVCDPNKVTFHIDSRTFDVSWMSDGELHMKCTEGNSSFVESAIKRDKRVIALASDLRPESIAIATIENMCQIVDSAANGILRLDMRIDMEEVETRICEMIRDVLTLKLGRKMEVSQVLVLVLCRKLDFRRCYICGAPSMPEETCSSQICRFQHLSNHQTIKISDENIDALKFIWHLAFHHTSNKLARMHLNLQDKKVLDDVGAHLSKFINKNEWITSLFASIQKKIMSKDEDLIRALWALSEEPVARLKLSEKEGTKVSFEVDWSRHPTDKIFSSISGFPIVRVYHGSPLTSWYNILTHGLRSMSNTEHMKCGAVYGPGIYVAISVETARSYSNVVGEFDMIHDETRVTTHGLFCHVVSDPCLLRLKRISVY